MTGEIPKELRIIGNHVALRVVLIILAIGSIILLAVLFKSGEPKVCVSEPSVQALCIHLNEKYGYGIPMKECKARQPYRSSTPAARD